MKIDELEAGRVCDLLGRGSTWADLSSALGGHHGVSRMDLAEVAGRLYRRLVEAEGFLVSAAEQAESAAAGEGGRHWRPLKECETAISSARDALGVRGQESGGDDA